MLIDSETDQSWTSLSEQEAGYCLNVETAFKSLLEDFHSVHMKSEAETDVQTLTQC